MSNLNRQFLFREHNVGQAKSAAAAIAAKAMNSTIKVSDSVCRTVGFLEKRRACCVVTPRVHGVVPHDLYARACRGVGRYPDCFLLPQIFHMPPSMALKMLRTGAASGSNRC